MMEQELNVYTLYNADLKEKVGVFYGFSLFKFLFREKKTTQRRSAMYTSANQKRTVLKKTTGIGFNAAIRIATKEDMELLGEDNFYVVGKYQHLILPGTGNFYSNKMGGFYRKSVLPSVERGRCANERKLESESFQSGKFPIKK